MFIKPYSAPRIQASCFRSFDVIITKSSTVAVVYGNTHPPGRVIAYPKYVAANRKTAWCRSRSLCFSRLPPYSSRYILEAEDVEYVYDNFYQTILPTISIFAISEINRPTQGFDKLLHNPSGNSLVETMFSFLDKLRENMDLPVTRIGITGSLLLGMHNEEISDIDIVVYGSSYIREVLEVIKENKLLVPFNIKYTNRFVSRCNDRDSIIEYWRRGIYKNKTVSLLGAPIECSSNIRFFYTNIALVDAIIDVEEGQETLLLTPASGLGTVREVRHILVLEKGVEKTDILRGIHKHQVMLEIYDNITSFLLYEGGCFRVTGLLSLRNNNDYVIKIGAREVTAKTSAK